MSTRLKIVNLLMAAVLFAGPVHAIDGDFGSPYDPGQQTNPVPRAPGEEPLYGGRDAAIPLLSWVGGALALAGVAALGSWRLRARTNR